MQNQKLCLKWNNHMSNMLSLLGSFQQKDMLVDVTISCQGQNIKAHKVILSACSPYFQNIFMENPCQHPIVIINGMKFEDITAILNFMYKGEVNVSHDGLSSFLQAAEALKVKGLAEVCGEKKGTNSISTQEVQQSELNRPQRTDTPPRKRPRNRKRSLSDSNRSDDELSRKHREPSSPEVHELSGDESFTGDNSSNGPPFNSISRVPQNVYSRSHQSHQSSTNMGAEDDDEYDVESNKMLDATDSNVSMNNTSSDNNLRIERIMGNATEIESSSMQDPESPPDIKPIINFGESSVVPSESGNIMLYNEQSQPGPSNVQDTTLLHDSTHAQDKFHSSFKNNARKMNNHSCETTRLLQELQEEPVCACHLENDDCDSSEVLCEDDFNFSSANNSRSPSKQLFIYNDQGCMKGFEVQKEIIGDDSRNRRMIPDNIVNDMARKEAYVLIENNVDFDNQGYSSNSNIPINNSFHYKSEIVDVTSDSDTRDTISLVSQTFPQYSLPKTLKRKKRRGWQKGRPRKVRTNTTGMNAQNSNQHSVPYTSTFLEQQSYTQVSVEEVHLAQSQNAMRQPHQSSPIKSPNEMLLLKRKIQKKIVQSRGFEYPSAEIHKHYNSKIKKGHSFNDSSSPSQEKKSSNQSEKQVVKYRRSTANSQEKYGPEILPPGWSTDVVTRKSGKTAGQIDIYFITPEKKRIRSKQELATYIKMNKLPLSAEEFIFRKGAYRSGIKMIENSKDLV